MGEVVKLPRYKTWVKRWVNRLEVDACNEADALILLAARASENEEVGAVTFETWADFEKWARSTLTALGWTVVEDCRIHPGTQQGGKRWSASIHRNVGGCEKCCHWRRWGVYALGGDGWGFRS